MSTFRRVFGVACFAYAALAFLWLFKLVSLDANLLVAGFLVITVVSFIIDALVARQEKKDADGDG
jgi:multisubunit Na+/H+ antiporter MnhE subunit